MLYMHVLLRKFPFNSCIREVLSSYKTSLFYLSRFAIRRLAPLFHVKSEEGDFTARKQQKWTTCKECHHNTKFPSRYMVKTNKQEFTYSVHQDGALTNSGNNIPLHNEMERDQRSCSPHTLEATTRIPQWNSRQLEVSLKHNLWPKAGPCLFLMLDDAWLAQLGERRPAEREVAGF